MAQSLKNIMGAGMGAETSKLIIGTIEDNIVSTGTTQADAYQLTQDVNVVSVAIANSGVTLAPIPQPGDEVLIANLGANVLSVYPGKGGSIQGGSVNAPYLLSAGACAVFSARIGSANWVVLSGGGTAPGFIPTLAALTFSATSFTVGAVTSGTIIGETALSTITATGLPTGLAINGAARTWAWDGTGTAGSGSFTLTETLAGAVGSPKPTTIGYTISAASGSLTISTAPTLSGDAVVGQTIFATNGTYSATPDSYTPVWSLGGVVQSDQTGTTLLVLDDYAGLAIGYSEIAHKASYTDSASNAATSTGAVANISLTNAITAFIRTSTSGTVPMTWSVTFAADVYEGYFLRARVFSDGTLTTQTQDITHQLNHADLQSGGTIDLTSDGLTTIGATQYLQLGVFTTSPNSIPFTYTYGTALSPTDAVVAMSWNTGDAAAGISVASGGVDATASSGVYGMIRSNRSKSTGKWYAEYKILATGNLTQVGWANATASLNNFLGADTNGVSVFNNGNFFYNGSNVGGPGVSWVVNDIIQCCIDKGTDTVWFGRNNTFTGSPSGGTGGTSVTGIGTVFAAFDAKAGEVLAQWLSASQTYTPPTGFTAIG